MSKKILRRNRQTSKSRRGRLIRRTKSGPGSKPSLVWFRHDLRLADNPALKAALKRGGPVIPVFVWAPKEEEPWPPGGASKWWLHRSLAALDRDLRRIGLRLIFRTGPTMDSLHRLAEETAASAVFWNRRHEPVIRTRDNAVDKSLRAAGVHADSFNGALLHEPWAIQNQSGKPFQVFTPFWKHCLTLPEPTKPLPAPRQIPAPSRWPASLRLEDLQLEPVPDWAGGLRASWQPGTEGAAKQLSRFLKDAFADYANSRNEPALRGTSRLSPHLHFGEISPRQIWHAVKRANDASEATKSKRGALLQHQFLTELGWREFSHHLLYHFPHTDTKPLRAEFERFRWRSNSDWLRAWQRGQTGYPFVDAGMRELWTTGWMHNRVRMVVASFLVKDLLLPWQEGGRWFWDTLVDADLAQNTLGWQWTAGCGADAAPYFRIFNPTSQGQKFDAAGKYIRRWVPELAALPDEWLHQPHAAPERVLADAGVLLGKTYPRPIVSHTIAREVALEVYAKIRTA
jgi:deoxyribodipyrimidine photo-lyase